ncbi:MAG: alpha/beta fold hydrolase [bacterium]
MKDLSKIDYRSLDRPEILMFLFHPRQEWGGSGGEGLYEEVLVPVEHNAVVGGRLYWSGRESPSILFFHGNGEIVADYEDLAPQYAQIGINFMPMDYRGYGRSTGRPTITSMMRDCHVIFDYVQTMLRERRHGGPLIVMGRSLGSASALELVYGYGNRIDGLIIESGFAYAEPLLHLLGIDMKALGITEAEGFRNVDKIRSFDKPTLIIHAENDHIIPLSDGQALYQACPAEEKRLLIIAGAHHNDIFLQGMATYLEAVRELADRSAAARRGW